MGHKASLKDKQDLNGNTHKWNAFVRSGDSQQQLEKIVKKVVFNLHETFKNPTRTCTTQPYCVKESGYGQFEFPIDIYFHGTDNKYTISYYLELPSLNTTQPLCRVRKEIITFINPCPEFRKVLIEGGGILKKHPAATSATNTTIASITPVTVSNFSLTSNSLTNLTANTAATNTVNDNETNNKLDAQSSTGSSLVSPITNPSYSTSSTATLSTTATSNNLISEKKTNLKKARTFRLDLIIIIVIESVMSLSK